MTEPTKVDFRHRQISQVSDVTDLVEMLFPGNRNQQHAAARILLRLKAEREPLRSLSDLEAKYSVSRRTLQRTRAKLSHLGLIEHASWMNSRYGGQDGWLLSGRMSSSLRRLAEWVDEWRKDDSPGRMAKDEQLVGLLR